MLRIKTTLCAMLLFALILALPALAADFHTEERDGKLALAEDSGLLLTDYIYDFIQQDLSEPPFAVKRNGHCGFIDAGGNEVVPAVYDNTWSIFSEGTLPVQLGGKWGFVDDAGRLIVGPWFDEVEEFSEGLAAVVLDGKWGCIDRSGVYVVEPRFDYVDDFHHGYAAVTLDGKEGLIDQTGNYVIKPRFDHVSYIEGGYAPVTQDGKTGLMDLSGAWVIEPEFDSEAEFSVDSDGLFSVTENYGGAFRYFDLSSGEAVEVRSVGSGIDLSDYMPFEGKKVATLDEKPTLDKRVSDADTLPRLDGATVLFPVYSAFCQAIYPKGTRYTELVTDEINGDALITCTKTNRAYERLIEGDADIIFVAQPSDEELAMAEAAGVEFDMRPIGREAFVFIVNQGNPLENITTDEIRGIYSGAITDWSQLGVDGVGPIVAYQRPKNSGSQTALEALMGDTPLMEAPQGVVAWDMGDIVDTVEYRNLPNAIGYTFRFFCTDMLNSEVKLLAVDGITPTEANIRNDTYPIAGTIYAIRLKGNDNPNVIALLDWIQSPQGMELVEKSGYTPWEQEIKAPVLS